jgi:hypothetical protein
LHEPELLFSGQSYLQKIKHFRQTAADQYEWLERFAEKLNMDPLRRYVIKNYVLQQCITRPERVLENTEFFVALGPHIFREISAWRACHPMPMTGEIFDFATDLTDIYFDALIDRADILRRGAEYWQNERHNA